MEEILDLIKNTEEFEQYVTIVEMYRPTFTVNSYQLLQTSKEDVAKAMLEAGNIERADDCIRISLYNILETDRHKELGNGEVSGSANYNAIITKDNDDLILSGSVDARFTHFSNTMFEEQGINKNINEEIVMNTFDVRFECKGDLYPSKNK